MAAADVQIPPDWRTLEINYDELAAKYEEERVKRVKKQGIDQYRHTVEEEHLQSLADDPFTEPGFTREPIIAEHEVIIVGAGVGGVIMGCRLAKAGFTNIRIIEKGGDFGGVW